MPNKWCKFIVLLQISVGCNASWDSFIEPVYLFYSTNYGMTWDYLVPQCLPGDPQCNGVVSPASVYHLNTGWRRVVIPLPEKLTSRYVADVYLVGYVYEMM